MQTSLEELLSSTLDAMPQAVLVVNPQGEILLRNAAAEHMLPSGRDVSGVLSAGGKAALNWDQELAELTDTEVLSRRGVAIDGRATGRLAVDLALRPIALGPGRRQTDAVLVVVCDATERLLIERQIQGRAALGGLEKQAETLVHELADPLDAVMRYLGLAESSSGQEASEHQTSARSGLEPMADILGALREESSRSYPLGQLLTDAVTAMYPRARALGVEITDRVDTGASISAGHRIFQVFCNVIKNALDAMDAGGSLSITAVRRGDQCVVEFADTGCGQSRRDTEAIFEPFYTTKPPGAGCGLGLAICRETLTALGGAIDAEGRPGGGVVVTVTLPLSNPQLNTPRRKES